MLVPTAPAISEKKYLNMSFLGMAYLLMPLVHDELNMDGNPSLNLASFVTTWMEPEANE